MDNPKTWMTVLLVIMVIVVAVDELFPWKKD